MDPALDVKFQTYAESSFNAFDLQLHNQKRMLQGPNKVRVD